MTVYIVLFRGVGGATQLPVKPLREALEKAGFENVATYINSGNAVVKSRLDAAAVVKKIAQVCAAEFGFGKDVYALPADDWRALINANPFPDATGEGRFLHAAVLGEIPAPDAIEKLRSFATGGERIEMVGATIYLHTPNGFGTSKLAEKFDKGIDVPNTARNWNTVLKLMELADRAV